jgi:osmotically-inducible protein OsmY
MPMQQDGRRNAWGQDDRWMRRDEWRPGYDEGGRSFGRDDRGERDRDEGFGGQGRFERDRDPDRDERRWDQRGPQHFGYSREPMGYSRGYGQAERVRYGTQGFDDAQRREYGEPGSYGQGQGYRGSSERERWTSDSEREARMRGQGIGGHRGKGPRNFTRSDERIRETVSEALSDDDRIDATNIEVKVSNGEVTLTGTVDERRIKRLAEDVVEGVPGVKDVQNQIRVQAEKTDGGKEHLKGSESQSNERRTNATRPS